MPAQKFSVAVVDDESPARKLLRYLLKKESDFEIICECENGRDAVKAIRSHTPDLVLLDIQMPDLDGFEVIRRLGTATLPHVIFVTAYDEFAVKAFEVHALDYILKPPIPGRFAEAINRVRKILKSGHRVQRTRYQQLFKDLEFQTLAPEKLESEGRSKAAFMTQFVVRDKSGLKTVTENSVDWIESADHYAYIHSRGVKHLIEKSLAELENKLDPDVFLRIRRNVIVNLNSVAGVRIAKFGAMEVILKDGSKIKTSRMLPSGSRKRLIMTNTVTKK
jgi:two-component system LytT family response regulator